MSETSINAEYLAFKLGREEYAVDILKVQEIRGYDAVTQIANAPASLKGVVNLRGVIVPIVDLRILLGLGTPTYDDFTVTIILNVGNTTVGAVVDAVSDVVQVTPEQMRPAPEMGASVSSDYVRGLATLAERMLILVDIDRLLAQSGAGLGPMRLAA